LEWEALSESERFYRTQEDPYKAFSLRWTDNKKNETLNREHLNQLEAQIAAGQLEIILTRKPEMNE
jgi:PHD/YefM family antitoxin component YafN of YafNO toxin-antitoxin module